MDTYAFALFFGGIGAGVFVGYVCARLDYIYVRIREWHEGASQIPQATGFFSERMGKAARQSSGEAKAKTQTKAQVVAEKIDIDTRTVVTEISTAGIQKGSQVELGTTSAKQDTINESVSRLAQLKGK
jgi:hypothetical protein